MIGFTVLGEPRGWARARLGKGGSHHFTDKKTASYESTVGATAHAAMQKMGVSQFDGPVELQLHVWLKIPASWSNKKRIALEGSYAPKKPDQDNALKIVMDGLNGVAWRDDVQVCRVVSEKRYGSRPRVDVVIREAEDF